MNERRLARLREQIKQKLAQVLQRDLADPKLGMVTITRIELDKEFTQCKAYWSVIAPTGKEEHARTQSAGVLERARGLCQREMGSVLHTRSVPHLEFHFDKGIGGAIKMQKLLKELTKDLPPDDSEGEEDARDPEQKGPGDAPEGAPE